MSNGPSSQPELLPVTHRIHGRLGVLWFALKWLGPTGETSVIVREWGWYGVHGVCVLPCTVVLDAASHRL